MPAITADYRKIIQIVGPLAAAFVAISASRGSAQADTPHMIVIPASDGYDFDDCLSANKPCGQVIADAWCEAHGLSASLSFGRADDITGSMPAKSGTRADSPKLEPGAFIVNCKG